MNAYLDHHATTPCDPRVLAAMEPHFAGAADPGMAKAEARAALGALLDAEPIGFRFTSGATEANNLAIKGLARANPHTRRRRVVTVATEHKCVLESVLALAREGFEPVVLPVDASGRPDPAALRAALATPTLLVSVMAAHNETGLLHDLPALAAEARAAGALFHTDAAQAAGKAPVRAGAWGIDLISVSGHKMYGPKGIGALWARPGVTPAPLFSGSEPPSPALLAGFAEAARIGQAEMAHEARRLEALRARMLAGLRQAVPGLRVNGPMARRLPGNLNLLLPRAADRVMADCPSLSLSAGSACAEAAMAPSAALMAMGLDAAAARRSLRVGLGRFTSEDEIDHAVRVLSRACLEEAEPCPA